MRPFITGISGFVGSHLAESFAGRGIEALGLSRDLRCASPGHVWTGDILNRDDLRRALAEAKPTHVFHCAGVFGKAEKTILQQVNVGGTRMLFEALLAEGMQPVVIIAGSSAVYGESDRAPIDETHRLAPAGDYGESKVAQEEVARSFSSRIPVVIARSFNLIGPRLSAGLAPSDLARQVAKAERDGDGTLEVRDAESHRDFIDVRDAVRALALLAERGAPGEAYNVCTGKSYTIRELMDLLVSAARKPLRWQQASNGTKPRGQVGSFERLRALTGWTPAIEFAQSVRDLLDDWRRRLQ